MIMTQQAASTFSYVTFIRTTPEKLWNALVEPEFARQFFFGAHFETDWKPGSPWKLVFPDGRVPDSGVVTEVVPQQRLVLTWLNQWSPEINAEGPGRMTMELEPVEEAVKLTVTHTSEVPDSKLIHAVSGGWPRILSNLKSLLETGEVVLKKK
jgi:uncharacterized protein YndB with AHSA1/START domain